MLAIVSTRETRVRYFLSSHPGAGCINNAVCKNTWHNNRKSIKQQPAHYEEQTQAYHIKFHHVSEKDDSSFKLVLTYCELLIDSC